MPTAITSLIFISKHAAIRSPLVGLWVWVNLLLFNVSNQRRLEAIQEDSKNKPWRPLPAGRLKSNEARTLVIFLHPVVALLSYQLGSIQPCLMLQFLTFLYNDLGAGDTWILRNVVNAGGFLSFIAGAVQVAVGPGHHEYCQKTVPWMLMLGAIIASTMHIQDLYDQEGDQLRCRKTIPLVFGDTSARYSVVFPVIFWSLYAPRFWKVDTVGYLPSTALGLLTIRRLLDKRTRNVASDKSTFKIWNLWIITLYLLPVFSAMFQNEVV
ncbi:MAG: hypothetical protein Q9224_002596 [Gallowayella concinna]